MMQATISTVLANTSFVFTGNHAVAAIAAVRAHKMIDAMGVPAGAPSGTPATRFQIPYSSVNLAQFQYTPDDTEVEDANCKTRTPADETKGLTIQNVSPKPNALHPIVTLGDTSINGTYGDATFTDGVANTELAHGSTLHITGLPDGTTYTISGSIMVTSGNSTGTIPALVTVTHYIA